MCSFKINKRKFRKRERQTKMGGLGICRLGRLQRVQRSYLYAFMQHFSFICMQARVGGECTSLSPLPHRRVRGHVRITRIVAGFLHGELLQVRTGKKQQHREKSHGWDGKGKGGLWDVAMVTKEREPVQRVRRANL